MYVCTCVCMLDLRPDTNEVSKKIVVNQQLYVCMYICILQALARVITALTIIYFKKNEPKNCRFMIN